jgi:hypothetical protein
VLGSGKTLPISSHFGNENFSTALVHAGNTLQESDGLLRGERLLWPFRWSGILSKRRFNDGWRGGNGSLFLRLNV